MRILLLILALGLPPGCGSIGGEGGGGDNLPNRGIVPYERHDGRVFEGSGQIPDADPEEALVIHDGETFDVHAPGALVADDGTIVLYVEVEGDDATWIAQTSSEDGVTFGALETVLLPVDVGAEPSRVGTPAAISVRGDTYLAFEVGDGASIGIARLSGGALAESESAVLAPDDQTTVHEPSLVFVDDVWSLYYEARTVNGDGLAEVRLATGSDWRSFSGGEAVFIAGTDCEDASGEPEGCWDRDGVGSPDVRVAETALGRRIYRLWYAGGEVNGRDIGFASSFDGRTWVRFPFNPVVSERPDEWSPSNVRVGERYLLYGALRSASRGGGVWAAVNDRPQASERF